MEKNIELKEISSVNIEEVLKLKVKDTQSDFVATTAKSLAYAYANRKVTNPYGIYDGASLIGYVSIIFDVEDNMYNIWHFLIDKNFQGKGLATLALKETLSIVKKKSIGKTDTVALSVEPENQQAIVLYEKNGFVKTGEVVEGELVMGLKF